MLKIEKCMQHFHSIGMMKEPEASTKNSNDINRNEMSKIERQKRIIETKRAQSFTERQTNIHIL